MKSKDVVIPGGMENFYEHFHFAPAVKDGDRLFCSGMIGLDAEGNAVKDPEKQYDKAFELLNAVLTSAGSSFSDVVEITSFHVGLQSQLEMFMKVKDRYLKLPYPAWTAIGISELAVPGALVEIKVTARLKA
jgi:enamine deaminase RidA (YjgF/YER057c/UK114 family)